MGRAFGHRARIRMAPYAILSASIGIVLGLTLSFPLNRASEPSQDAGESVPSTGETVTSAFLARPPHELEVRRADERSPTAAGARSPVKVLAPGAIEGTLSDDRGTPLDGRAIVLELDGGRESCALSAARADGTFGFAGLEAGTWRILARGPGLHAEEQTVDLTRERPTVRADLVLQRERTVGVTLVTPAGKRLALEVARAAPPWLLMPEIVTLEGCLEHFETASRPARADHALQPCRSSEPVDATLVVPLDGLACIAARMGSRILALESVEPEACHVELTIEPSALADASAHLALWVLDARDGALVPGLVCQLSGRDGRPRRARAGVGGELSFGPCVPGDAVLTIRARGRERIRRQLTLEPGRNDLGEIRLAAGHTVGGRLIDALGPHPSAGLALSLRSTAGTWLDLPLTAEERPGIDGRFELAGLTRGRYRLCALPEAMGCIEFDIDDAPPPDITLRVGSL